MQRWNGAALLPPPPPAVTVETDASTFGWGAAVANAPLALRRSQATVNGRFAAVESRLHITWKELFAATEGVTRLALANGWRNLHVRVRTDATTVVPYLNKMGGRRPRLHAQAAAFHHWCLRRGLHVSARHLAGVDNVTADALSRPQTRYGEHQLTRAAWRDLFPPWPPPVDLFATASTTRSPRYFSRVRDPTQGDGDGRHVRPLAEGQAVRLSPSPAPAAAHSLPSLPPPAWSDVDAADPRMGQRAVVPAVAGAGAPTAALVASCHPRITGLAVVRAGLAHPRLTAWPPLW